MAADGLVVVPRSHAGLVIGIETVVAGLSSRAEPLATTGIQQLDDATRGLRPGTLWVVTGLPRQGRTMLSMQMARRAAAQGTPTQVLAGADPLTYYASLLSAGAEGLPLHEVLRGERSAQAVAHLPIELTTRRHTSLEGALHEAPERCLLVLDDADLWDGHALRVCQQVHEWLTPSRAAVVTVPRTLVGPERPDWQPWVRCAEVVVEIEMGAGQAAGDVYFTVLSNRSGPVTSAAGQGLYYRAQFVDFHS